MTLTCAPVSRRIIVLALFSAPLTGALSFFVDRTSGRTPGALQATVSLSCRDLAAYSRSALHLRPTLRFHCRLSHHFLHHSIHLHRDLRLSPFPVPLRYRFHHPRFHHSAIRTCPRKRRCTEIQSTWTRLIVAAR
ncbi:hypothetical protein PF008_g21993 [Phytophthora fragariae]|uniref:Uncharacterized protein n=1 Tax=Phytophthora fragariae TaxID=53985 RepID=A0A6G0QUY7_9STRA|nr:hypothetical protein PF008_g21993 [Phytophthora fragariae]